MDGIWSLQADAVVRTPTVVKLDEAPDLLQSLLVRLEAPLLTVHALMLDGAVHTLGDGVVRRLVVLRHRDQYAMPLQFLHIEIAAVLHAAVGVVDETGKVATTCLSYSHTESPERGDGRQGIG